MLCLYSYSFLFYFFYCFIFIAALFLVFSVLSILYNFKPDKIRKSNFAVEDLNLNAVESLQGVPFLATGKHLCGAATGDFCNLNMHSDEIHDDSFIVENIKMIVQFF